ncbi:MAG: hypothetical protein OMM_08753 [Candidatus Magnetoglobus multicellularis str. Araruama]|uniref:Uncharacterized protein n=1 Tax=Candidatus Magnetoglobus multicellularis str. Araruama TaxID=890399 RepID=A0A1V1P717_9BACT|nr:MAG: hypothetical protein OMM_08753 [Candidatus Magnetoglobus multicellularis str. Araruama]
MKQENNNNKYLINNSNNLQPENTTNIKPEIKFVSHLPDLMTMEDYNEVSNKKKVRIRIQNTDSGIEIIGDSMHDYLLEDILARAGALKIERTLCG